MLSCIEYASRKSYSKKFKQAATWMNLENIMLSKRNQSPKMWFHLHEIYRIGKYIHSWFELTGGKWEVTINGDDISF